MNQASFAEIADRFGTGSDARTRAVAKLAHLLELAEQTGKLLRFLIFGSFVSATKQSLQKTKIASLRSQ